MSHVSLDEVKHYFKTNLIGRRTMGHVPPEAMKRYFEAHSIWDETMAFQTNLHIKHTYTPFFIIVGNFHAKYKLGLTASLKRRMYPFIEIVTIVHIDAKNLSTEEVEKLTIKHPRYGETWRLYCFYILIVAKQMRGYKKNVFL